MLHCPNMYIPSRYFLAMGRTVGGIVGWQGQAISPFPLGAPLPPAPFYKNVPKVMHASVKYPHSRGIFKKSLFLLCTLLVIKLSKSPWISTPHMAFALHFSYCVWTCRRPGLSLGDSPHKHTHQSRETLVWPRMSKVTPAASWVMWTEYTFSVTGYKTGVKCDLFLKTRMFREHSVINGCVWKGPQSLKCVYGSHSNTSNPRFTWGVNPIICTLLRVISMLPPE